MRACVRLGLCVCVSARVIGQCHSHDLSCRYRCTVQTYESAGMAKGGGQSTWGGLDSICCEGSDELGSDQGYHWVREDNGEWARQMRKELQALWADLRLHHSRGREAARRTRLSVCAQGDGQRNEEEKEIDQNKKLQHDKAAEETWIF